MKEEDENNEQHRLETGVVKLGKDWPGVFIRGDSCFYYAHSFETLLKVMGKELNEYPFLRALLENLSTLFLSSSYSRNDEMQILKSYEDCKIDK